MPRLVLIFLTFFSEPWTFIYMCILRNDMCENSFYLTYCLNLVAEIIFECEVNIWEIDKGMVIFFN